MVIYSDARNSGWMATYANNKTGSIFSLEESKYNMNSKYFLAATFTLNTLVKMEKTNVKTMCN